MKKRIVLFLTVLAFTLCLLAVAVNAGDIYSDFTQNGINGESPVFNMRGYSVNEQGGGICVDYDVNIDALEAYKASTGKALEFGVVISRAENTIDGKPLDANGNPIGVDASKVYKVNLSNQPNSLITLILQGISAEKYNEEVVMALYVNDGTGVKYITEGKTTDAPAKVSYNSIKNPVLWPEEYKISDQLIFSVNKPDKTIAWDRERQMGISAEEYGTPVVDPNTYTDSKMKSVLNGAKTIAGNGILGLIVKGVYPNASRFMAHYLENTGTDMTIDMGTGSSGFFKSGSGTLTHRTSRINEALRAAEYLAREGQSISVYQQGEIVNHFGGTEDWYLAVGSYFTCIEMHEVTVTENADGTRSYSAQLKYSVTDYYNWNENSWSEIPIVNVSQRDLHQLHRTKQAKEFESTGSITYSITWTEGQDASALSLK